MDNKESKLTPIEEARAFAFKELKKELREGLGFMAFSIDEWLELMETYAEEVSKQRVLEALEKEVPKAFDEGIKNDQIRRFKEVGLAKKMESIQSERYYETEVKPKYSNGTIWIDATKYVDESRHD